VGKLAGIPHLKAIRAFEKAGFKIVRQSKIVVMSNGTRILTIPRYTADAIQVAGLTIEQFRRLR